MEEGKVVSKQVAQGHHFPSESEAAIDNKPWSVTLIWIFYIYSAPEG